MSLYATDGSINVTVVDGTSRTGRYASDGSWNVVISDGSVPVGINHPCGALWVTPVTSGLTNRYAADGSLNVVESPYGTTGAMRVTVVTGDLSAGNFLELADGASFLLLSNGSDKLILEA